MSLNEKLERLRETVAIPSADEWALLCKDNSEIIEELNTVLLEILEKAKSPTRVADWMDFSDIRQAVSEKIGAIDAKYPDCGIKNSEGAHAVALFFALNFDPAIYDNIRYDCYEAIPTII